MWWKKAHWWQDVGIQGMQDGWKNVGMVVAVNSWRVGAATGYGHSSVQGMHEGYKNMGATEAEGKNPAHTGGAERGSLRYKQCDKGQQQCGIQGSR